MLDSPPLTPGMVRRVAILGRAIPIIWTRAGLPHIPAADLAAITGLDIENILAYAQSPVLSQHWHKFSLIDTPDGVDCIALPAVPTLLTAMAIQMTNIDTSTRLIEMVAQESIGVLAEHWRCGNAAEMTRDRLSTYLDVAGMFPQFGHDLDVLDAQSVASSDDPQ